MQARLGVQLSCDGKGQEAVRGRGDGQKTWPGLELAFQLEHMV